MAVEKLWEYMWEQYSTNQNADEATQHLNRMGASGWELLTMTFADKTLGFNALILVWRRPMPGLVLPLETAPAWLSDPSGRYESRYFNGVRWTEHVSSGGITSSDPPSP